MFQTKAQILKYVLPPDPHAVTQAESGFSLSSHFSSLDVALARKRPAVEKIVAYLGTGPGVGQQPGRQVLRGFLQGQGDTS